MNIDKIEFDNDLFVQLQAETEMDPYLHDGSYELVQETVKAYKNVSIDDLNYLDLNCIYLMTVGTWKHSFDKKEETINKSHLADEDKTYLISVLRRIQQDAENNKYENRESGNPTCGMFGTGFYNFQTKTNDNSVRQFIKLCLDIIPENDEEKLFAITEEALKTKINGMQTGSISQILHCLKPTVFPILNGHMQQDTIFAKFSIDINDSKDSTQYISNCRKIKKFRDDNFSFKNYRIMDKFTTYIENNQKYKKVWKLSHGKDFSDDEVQNYLNESTVCVHKDTLSKGVSSLAQGKAFTDEAKEGDLFYLCRGNQGILLIGEFISDEIEIDDDGWAYRKYKKLYSAIKEGSYEGPNKWWTPNNNSTFIEIKKNEYSDFEKLILIPFFGINLKTINLVSGENEMDNINECRKLLENTHNLILHGAPGTGKTHLAKEIAQAMNAEVEFVQFHPSYDYTDFVEGLRPVHDDNGEVVFERIDGVFKKFCKKALTISSKDFSYKDFDKSWDNLIETIRNNLSNNKLTKIGNWDFGLSKSDSLKYSSVDSPSQYNFTITKQNILDVYSGKLGRPSGAFQKDMERIVKYMKENHGLKDFSNTTTISETTNYVFIIDEINRGELSKIFGELFYNIDPGYRGTAGKINTQYQNLIEEGDPFYEGFFIPDNVYIIGTMNDIDRSVESMDFAFRRRFTFKEITAEDTQESILAELDETIRAEAIKRMNSLNNKIWHKPTENEAYEDQSIEGLSSAYHIGGAYFLKLKELNYDFDKLWEYHLSGLLREYLRGMEDAEELLEKLHKAYNLESQE